MCWSAPRALLTLNITLWDLQRETWECLAAPFLIHLHLCRYPISLATAAVWHSQSSSASLPLTRAGVSYSTFLAALLEQRQPGLAQQSWRYVLTWPNLCYSCCETFESLVLSHRKTLAHPCLRVQSLVWPSANTPSRLFTVSFLSLLLVVFQAAPGTLCTLYHFLNPSVSYLTAV